MSTINRFDGDYRWLSNFYSAPTMYEGVLYTTSEHAYQAAKFHPNLRDPFQHGTAGQAKRLGRRPGKREDWDTVKVGIMLEILRDKFRRNVFLGQRLIGTGGAELIEGNTWGDTFWGVCRGTGENWLGRVLMTVRQELVENPQ